MRHIKRSLLRSILGEKLSSLQSTLPLLLANEKVLYSVDKLKVCPAADNWACKGTFLLGPPLLWQMLECNYDDWIYMNSRRYTRYPFQQEHFGGTQYRQNDELKPEIKGEPLEVLMKMFSTHTVSPANRLLIFIHSHPPSYFRQRSLGGKSKENTLRLTSTLLQSFMLTYFLLH